MWRKDSWFYRIRSTPVQDGASLDFLSLLENFQEMIWLVLIWHTLSIWER